MSQYFTQEALEKLKRQLEELQTVRRKEIAERIRHAASFGDLSENAAYSEAKEAQLFLEKQIHELRQLIKNALISEKSVSDRVQIGSLVIIQPTAKKKGAEQEKFTLVGSMQEANPLEGKISAESPFGKALINLKKGDKFVVETPGGKVQYKILNIE